MKKMSLLLAILPTFCLCQRTYNVTGMMVNLTNPVINSGLAKANSTVVITDSSMTVEISGKTLSYTIVKKVNDNYFKVSDGLKDYLITIENESPVYKRFKGSIREEYDKGVIIFFFK